MNISSIHKSFTNSIEEIKYFYLTGIIDLKPAKTPYHPISLNIEPTNRCMLNCRYCLLHHTKEIKRPIGNMDFSLYKKIIDDIQGKIKLIQLVGQGEPLLNKNIIKMVEYAKTQDLQVSLISNAVLLNEDMMKRLIDARLDIIHVSFDCVDRDHWIEYKRGKPDWYDRTKKNVENAIDLSIENDGPQIHIGLIDYGDNCKNSDLFLEYWTNRLKNKGRCSPQSLINMWGLNDSDKSLEWYNLIKNEIREKKCLDQSFPVCFSPWINCLIYWDGRVNACTYDPFGRMIIGDAKKESFLKIWNGKKMQMYRKWMIERKFDETGNTGAICRSCNLLFCPEDNMRYSTIERIKIMKYNLFDKKNNSGISDLNKLFKYDFKKHNYVRNESINER
jgi:MoaA/NifB/PqqE/SkfB family radical SAM enzyme